MTDNEIIKVLECCVKEDCRKCPISHIECCMDNVVEEALALINRQKAEIDRFIVDATTYKLRWAKATAKLDTAKAEAIKMLLTEAKEQAYVSSDWSHGEHPLVIEWDDLEEVAEEMVGANNER